MSATTSSRASTGITRQRMARIALCLGVVYAVSVVGIDELVEALTRTEPRDPPRDLSTMTEEQP